MSDSLRGKFLQAIAQVENVILGKTEVVKNILISILVGGHCLLEDLPGVGKTMLAKTIGKILFQPASDVPIFKRIQFTPDLLPSDILGVNIFVDSGFKFVRGPIFSHILLADEINRAGPKVQSALLEAMAEKQVTIDNETHKLPEIFTVIATQNPLDLAGTYPLPIAQLDRFLMRIPMLYADPDVEEAIIKSEVAIQNNLKTLSPVLTIDDFLEARRIVEEIYVCSSIVQAILEIGILTRAERGGYGLSTRALILLKKACQARAFLEGRNYVSDEDLKRLYVPVLNHRLGLRSMSEAASFLEALTGEIFKQLPAVLLEELKSFQ
jgi:MoxR-like ATPase